MCEMEEDGDGFLEITLNHVVAQQWEEGAFKNLGNANREEFLDLVFDAPVCASEREDPDREDVPSARELAYHTGEVPVDIPSSETM